MVKYYINQRSFHLDQPISVKNYKLLRGPTRKDLTPASWVHPYSFFFILGTEWVLYCVWVSFVVSALFIVWVKPTYGRLDVDVTSDVSTDAASSSVQVTSRDGNESDKHNR